MKKLIILFFVLISLSYGAKNTISKKVYSKLQKAQKLIEKKEYTKAKDILTPIINTSKNNMEKTYAYQSLANIYINLNKYKTVIKYYKKILNLNTLEEKDIYRIKFSLSQLYLSEAMYKKSIKFSLELLNKPKIKQNRLIENLALAYYYDKQYKKSTLYIKKVINAKKKKEPWYRMLYSSYIELKDYKNAISTLKVMITKYSSKEEYWLQLVSIYQNTKKYKKALATLELAYKKNIVNKNKNLMYFVSILIRHELYNKAALFLEQGFKKNILKKNKKNFNIYISCQLNAKNYDEVVKTLKTKKLGNLPKYKIMLANIYYNRGEYKKVFKVLKNYKFKKGSRFQGKKFIMLALCAYELDKKKSTNAYLKKAYRNKYEKKRASSIAKSLDVKI